MVLDRALAHYRKGGLSRLVSKARDQFAFSREYATFGLERALLTDRQWYTYTVWRNRRGVDAAADPRQLRYVDPRDIVHTSPFETLFCFRKFGSVRGGDWDRDCERLDERFDYIWEALDARYEQGAAWEDVDLVQQVLDGEERWRFATGEEVWEWVERLDAVYASIRRDGYRSARELLDVPFETAAAPTHDSLRDRFRPVTNESMLFESTDDVTIFDWLADIQVDIGRDGEVIQHNGRHRLWMAQHFGLHEIPVCVVVRHEQWQALRDEVSAATSVAELSDRARRHLDHPDMVDVRENLGRPDETTNAGGETRTIAADD
ncbi:hypothetical protein [Halomarina oriensis]|uniref:ParB/Sulfiredoxin domain-containing protein n=1 Tax=Halomarina oriensis TaxID=671145 RepID=A0A6B0GP88_9EURY|nr:hypothetical protein [Halomarina oriensis]MWG36624.1 hypothetical protein [Halomarina oriensis]